MRALTDIELVQRGERARALFDNAAYHEAHASLIDTFTTQITDSDYADTVGRERYFSIIRGLQLLHTELESHVATGANAAQRLADAQHAPSDDDQPYEEYDF